MGIFRILNMYSTIKGLIILLLVMVSFNLNAQIVLVSHKNSQLEDLSIEDVRKIYKGEMSFHPNSKQRIITCEFHELKSDFYKAVYNWSVLKFKKHWMKLIFSGENLRAPTTFKSKLELINFLTINEGGIAYMKLSDVSEELKIIRIDGKTPDHPDYFLKYE